MRKTLPPTCLPAREREKPGYRGRAVSPRRRTATPRPGARATFCDRWGSEHSNARVNEWPARRRRSKEWVAAPAAGPGSRAVGVRGRLAMERGRQRRGGRAMAEREREVTRYITRRPEAQGRRDGQQASERGRGLRASVPGASGRAGGSDSAPLPHPPARGSLTFRAAPGHHARAQPLLRASRGSRRRRRHTLPSPQPGQTSGKAAGRRAAPRHGPRSRSHGARLAPPSQQLPPLPLRPASQLLRAPGRLSPPVPAAARCPGSARTHRARRTRAARARPEATPAPPSFRAGARRGQRLGGTWLCRGLGGGEGGPGPAASPRCLRRLPPGSRRPGQLANPAAAAATRSPAPPRPARAPQPPRARGPGLTRFTAARGYGDAERAAVPHRTSDWFAAPPGRTQADTCCVPERRTAAHAVERGCAPRHGVACWQAALAEPRNDPTSSFHGQSGFLCDQ